MQSSALITVLFHASLCTIQSKKFCSDFHFFIIGYLLDGHDDVMPLAIAIFPQARYNYYITLTDYSS